MNVGASGGGQAQGLIAKLGELNQKRKGELEDEKRGFSNQVTELASLKTKLTTLQTKFKDMEDGSHYSMRKTSVGTTENPFLKATASSGMLKGDYQFQIDVLATETVVAGGSDVGSALSGTTDVSGVVLSSMPSAVAIDTGVFTINGARIEVYDPAVTTPTETYSISTSGSLADLFTVINTATTAAGSAVTAAYNNGTDKVDLTSGGEIVLGGGADTSNVLSVLKLRGNGTGAVSSDLALGATALNGTIDNSNLSTAVTSGTHSFKVNGVEFSYDPSVDSIKGLMQKVGASSAMADITYDPTYDKFTIKNKSTGNIGLNVEDVSGNLMEAMGLVTGSTTTKGVDAQFRVNGDSTVLYSNSNVLDGSVHGLEGLSVTALRVGTDTVTVEQDSASTREFLEDFITKYNDVMTFIDTKTKVTADVKEALAYNRGVMDIETKMRGFMFEEVDSLAGGAVKRLYDIGIDFEGQTNKLRVANSALLDEVLQSNDIEVTTLFTDTTDGLVKLNKDYVDAQLETGNAVFDQKTEALNSQIKGIDDQIEKLRKEFEEMEQRNKEAEAQVEALMGEMDRNAQMIKGLSTNKK